MACRRRSQALLTLIGMSFETPLVNVEEAPLDTVVSKLIVISTPPPAVAGAEELRDTSLVSQKTLNQLLSVMPAKAFLAAIASILQTDDSRVSSLVTSDGNA